MLILTRKQQEVIWIGDDVQIKVIRTSPTTVKLGIDAPADVRILRGELREDSTDRVGSEVLQEDSHGFLKSERAISAPRNFTQPFVA